MRVILLNRYFHPDHSATSQLATQLASGLVAAGATVSVITSRQRYDDAEAQYSPLDSHLGVSIRRVWTTRFGRMRLAGRAVDYLSYYLSATLGLLAESKRGDVVVVMTDPPLMAVPVTLMGVLRGFSVVNWLQDVFPEVAEALGVLKHRRIANLLRRVRNWSLRRADASVAIGSGMAKAIEHKAGIDVTVIPNWAVAECVDGPAPRLGNPLRDSWRLGDSFVVGYSGNMGRAHDLLTVIEAAAILRDRSGIRFLLIGDGAQRVELRRRVEELGLENVIFRPYQPIESLVQSLSVPDVHLVSLDPELENLIVPSKFVGALAVGRPVIFLGDHTGEVARVIAEAGCGATCPPRDAGALARAVATMAGSRESGAELARNAWRHWHRHLRSDLALAAWHAALDDVVRRRGSRSSADSTSSPPLTHR